MDDTELFLVRVWHLPQATRAAVQQVGTDAARVFTEPLALGRHLLAGDPPVAPAPAPEAP